MLTAIIENWSNHRIILKLALLLLFPCSHFSGIVCHGCLCSLAVVLPLTLPVLLRRSLRLSLSVSESRKKLGIICMNTLRWISLLWEMSKNIFRAIICQIDVRRIESKPFFFLLFKAWLMNICWVRCVLSLWLWLWDWEMQQKQFESILLLNYLTMLGCTLCIFSQRKSFMCLKCSMQHLTTTNTRLMFTLHQAELLSPSFSLTSLTKGNCEHEIDSVRDLLLTRQPLTNEDLTQHAAGSVCKNNSQ